MVRLSIFTSAAAFNADPTWWITKTENWVLAEYSSGLICASLIHLKPLAKKLLPFLLGDTPGSTQEVERALPQFREREFYQLSRGFGRKHRFISRPLVPWISTSLRSKGSGGTTEIDGMVKVTTQFEGDYEKPPRSPDKAFTWSPKELDRIDTRLLRNSSPV